MYYDNPNFNVIILSPGRTGSTLIWDVFSKISKVAPIRRNYDDTTKPLVAKECLHSHNPDDIKLGNEHTLYVISKRNLIDSTLSSVIVKHTGKFLYYSNQNYEISPFILDPEQFMSFYNFKKTFYEELKPNIPKSSVIVDYNDFADNLEKLFEILKLSKNNLKLYPKSLLIQKTIGTYKDWIINYDEIINLTSNLIKDPCI